MLCLRNNDFSSPPHRFLCKSYFFTFLGQQCSECRNLKHDAIHTQSNKNTYFYTYLSHMYTNYTLYLISMYTYPCIYIVQPPIVIYYTCTNIMYIYLRISSIPERKKNVLYIVYKCIIFNLYKIDADACENLKTAKEINFCIYLNKNNRISLL